MSRTEANLADAAELSTAYSIWDGGVWMSMAPWPLAPEVRASSTPQADQTRLVKKLICTECGGKISYTKGKFCWGNMRRFRELQYCREHQAMFRRGVWKGPSADIREWPLYGLEIGSASHSVFRDLFSNAGWLRSPALSCAMTVSTT